MPDKKKGKSSPTTVKALIVNQWINDWDQVDFDETNHRRKPEDRFYIFSLPARQLRALSGVNRRSIKGGKRRSSDLGIQRAHEFSRSKNIAAYIQYGYPWSDLTKSQRQDKYNDLRKPGWLPTAIVVNILTSTDKRDRSTVASRDLIKVEELSDNIVEIHLPKVTTTWKPTQRPPLEIIDGQHRLLAFDENISEDYELPVVAFYGLDISWQAYLFWTINIKPRRINPSLAFDLYPLLRTEDWLERFEGHKVYREARSQEIVESVWSEPYSAWYQRVNMLGEGGVASVTQAAWIRALLKTYVKAYEGKGVVIGGLFGAKAGADEMTIPWNRSQQAALLIYLWNAIEECVKETKLPWARKLRKAKYKKKPRGDAAFVGPHTLLNNDQGITVVLNVTNDLLFVNADKLKLNEWQLDTELTVKEAFNNLRRQKAITRFIQRMARAIAAFDWRSSAADGLTEVEKTLKLSYRGGSGYREFRRRLLKHLFDSNYLGDDAEKIYEALGYE